MESMVDSIDRSQKLLNISLKDRAYKCLLNPYKLLRSKLWDKQGTLSTENSCVLPYSRASLSRLKTSFYSFDFALTEPHRAVNRAFV